LPSQPAPASNAAGSFPAVYDYCTAGAWACLLADSAAQICERLPKPHVVTDRPDWLTDEETLHLPSGCHRHR
jgi:hypothetical protein